jgi:hypothetical protein
MAEWRAQPEDSHSPTLPEVAGKVDVRNLVRALRLPAGHEQHFYNKTELRTVVNVIAEKQGLRGIGSRVDMDVEDQVIADRMTQVQRDRSDCARALAEANAQIERLRRETISLRAQLEFRTETGMTIRPGDGIDDPTRTTAK